MRCAIRWKAASKVGCFTHGKCSRLQKIVRLIHNVIGLVLRDAGREAHTMVTQASQHLPACQVFISHCEETTRRQVVNSYGL